MRFTHYPLIDADQAATVFGSINQIARAIDVHSPTIYRSIRTHQGHLNELYSRRVRDTPEWKQACKAGLVKDKQFRVQS